MNGGAKYCFKKLSHKTTFNTLKNQMILMVNYCSSLHEGGESYFNELDNMIKCNEEMIINYISWAVKDFGCNNIVISGEIGQIVHECIINKKLHGVHLLTVPGGIRHGKQFMEACQNALRFISGRTFDPCDAIFIDDSFYSGKTYYRTMFIANMFNYHIKKAYVFYDGSKDKKDDVISLYRYWDFHTENNSDRQLGQHKVIG